MPRAVCDRVADPQRGDAERRVPRPLPVGIELSAYRIVQEALTNSLKHAGGAPTTVRVGYGADVLELDVTDAGVADPNGSGDSGHGLVGMRERVALCGGSLQTSRNAAGGFTVHAALPTR